MVQPSLVGFDDFRGNESKVGPVQPVPPNKPLAPQIDKEAQQTIEELKARIIEEQKQKVCLR